MCGNKKWHDRKIPYESKKRVLKLLCYIYSLYSRECWTFSPQMKISLDATEMWIYGPMMRMPCTGYLVNKEVLRKIQSKRLLILKVRKKDY